MAKFTVNFNCPTEGVKAFEVMANTPEYAKAMAMIQYPHFLRGVTVTVTQT